MGAPMDSIFLVITVIKLPSQALIMLCLQAFQKNKSQPSRPFPTSQAGVWSSIPSAERTRLPDTLLGQGPDLRSPWLTVRVCVELPS